MEHDRGRDDGLVSLETASAALGLHPRSIRRRLARMGAALWSDPRDRRRRLTTRAALDALLAPLPLRRGEPGGPDDAR